MDKKERTTSTKFLLRPLGIIKKSEKISESRIKDFGFIDAFIKDVNHEQDYTHPLYLLFKQENSPLSFREFIQDEYDRGLLLEDYDYPEGYIVLLYDYPDRFRDDYEKILEGKYSETSKEFQDFFPDKVELDGKMEVSVYYRVFHKAEDLRKHLEEKYGLELPEDSEVRRAPYIGEIPVDKINPKYLETIPSETLNIKNYIDG